MLRLILAITISSLVVSCDKLNSNKQAPPAPEAHPPTAKSPAVSTPALPGAGTASDKVKATAAEASKTVESAGADIKKTADAGAEKAKEVVATAKVESSKAVEAAKDVVASMPELANLTEGSFSVEKLKEMAGNFKPEQLKGIADKVLVVLQEKQGLVKSLTDQIGKLGLGDVLNKADLTKQLASNSELVTSLMGKLQVVVDKLKASGLDVTKYVSALTGK